MDAKLLLKYLPPYYENELVIEKDQDVYDIIKEVLAAHREFAEDYDCISQFFEADSLQVTAKKLFDFCKQNTVYEVEPKEDQTSRSPAAMLTIGYVDCKHYAGFIGGILDSLKRRGYKIDWCYRFASYDLLEEDPGHVFVVIKENGDETWIDPVLSSYNERLVPFYIVDKKIKMLTRLSGIQLSTDPYNLQYGPVVDYRDNSAVSGFTTIVKPVNYSVAGNGSNPNPYLPGPFLGLSSYVEDTGAILLPLWDGLANAINAEILVGPDPSHQVNSDFVKWIYENNFKGWNFYYYGGVKPGFIPYNLPTTYPRAIITADNRLTFDRNVELDDAHTSEIHALWAQVQDLINRFDKEDVQPIKPATLKGFSQGKYGGIDGGSLFIQYRGDSIFKQVGQALEDSINFVKDVGLKIIGSIPRNAFLGLVGINVFGMATSLQNKINAGQWSSISKTWQSVGGNPDKLKNTIEDGAKKNAIMGAALAMGEPTTAGLLAAAAPILAIMLKYLDKDGKMTEVLSAAKTYISANYPDLDLTDFGFLDKATGQPVNIVIDPADNENLGGGNDDLPPDDKTFFDKIKNFFSDNPLVAIGIAFAGWELLAPKKYRLINK
jgi:hypothetical protein